MLRIIKITQFVFLIYLSMIISASNHSYSFYLIKSMQPTAREKMEIKIPKKNQNKHSG
jgi:hypothetical protein